MGDVAADSPVTSISGQERDVTLALRLSRSLQVEVVGLKQRRVVLRRAVCHIVLRAGRLTPPEGKLTLTMSGNRDVRDDVLRYVRAAHAS
jgi:hypothetical protein